MSDSIKDHPALKWRDGAAACEDERLAVEEPLEIRLGGRRFTLTMRTPGHDEELTAGFLLAEGFIAARGELGEIRRVRAADGAPDPNVLDVILGVPAAKLRERLKRNFTISSSCGVCGKTSIEALQRRLEPLHSRLSLASETVIRLPPMMRAAQQVFAATGGLHAAALFGVSSTRKKSEKSAHDSDCSLIVLREDVGRHNAVDKVIGYAVMHDLLPLDRAVVMVSGRLSFEIVQKTAAAGVPILCAVSAPSSLAVDLADEVGMTLVGFVRQSGFNVYTHRERILA
ncbi:MAG: formate dehydrogenase accessory sulfurtransferase FdhD [Candidatus Binataceae bacterium]